nr:2047_t:CDS:2 [Entrophospora candida]
MSFKLKSFKLPSKKVMTFFGTCIGISGLIYRDNVLSKEAKKNVQDRVSHLALEPLGVHELPRKVFIYLAPPVGDGLYKTREYFREYVKPILVAAALDYEVVEGARRGELKSKVCEEIIQKRRDLSSNTDNKDPSSLNRVGDGGIIVVGRVGWVEFLEGLNQGCFSSLEEPADDSTKQENQEYLQINKSTQEIQSNEEEFSIPKVDPVGYIHFYNRIGWKNFPLRVYHFFNSYKNFEIAGEEAVGIVLGKTRDFKSEDLDFGKDEEMFFKDELSEPKLDKRIANNLKIYTLGT